MPRPKKPTTALFDEQAPAPLDGEVSPPAARRKTTAKAARDQLTNAFLSDVMEIWEEQGQSILRRAAFYEPTKFAQMVANLTPKTLEIQQTSLQELPDEKLEALLENLERQLADGTGRAAEKARSREGGAGPGKQAPALPAIRQAD